jgi:hypothetical protein
MKCIFCGEEHPAGTVFCPRTGQKIDQSRFCPTCGKKLEESWKVCPKCGTAVADTPVGPTRGGVPAKPPGIKPDKRVNRGRQILLGSLVILPLLAILGITYQVFFRIPVAEPEREALAPTPAQTEKPLTPTPRLDPTPTTIPLPTLSPPLEGVEFPSERINYPSDWPVELRYPGEFMLVETSSGSSELGGPKGWAAKLRIEADLHSAADLLASFFTAQGWQIHDREELDSGGVLILLEKKNGANQGILVFDSDLTDPSYTNILATVFP